MEKTMKKQILSIIIALSVISTLSIAGFAGLTGNLQANIPFDFMVNGKKLPAGKYTLGSAGPQNVLSVRSWKLKQGAFATTYALPDSSDNKPKLIFHRYGNQYFLARVIGYADGVELPRSKAESEAAKKVRDIIGMNDLTPEIITINAQIGQ
jgi:hypothetical protein